MNEAIKLVAASPNFAFIAGLTSMLGCLLAVYPVNIGSLHPSVYRSLVWHKTLIWSIGLSFLIFSIAKVANSPLSLHDSKILYMMTSSSKDQNHKALRGVDALDEAKFIQVQHVNPISTLAVHNQSNVLQNLIRTQVRPMTPEEYDRYKREQRAEEKQRLQLDFHILIGMIGLILMAIGFSKNPFREITKRVNDLTESMEARRAKYHALLAKSNLSKDELDAAMTRHDRYAVMIHAALFYSLTGFRFSTSLAPDTLESLLGMKEFADQVLSRKSRGTQPQVDSKERAESDI